MVLNINGLINFTIDQPICILLQVEITITNKLEKKVILLDVGDHLESEKDEKKTNVVLQSM